jgi:hypothetical protein
MLNWNLMRQLGCGDINIGSAYDCTTPLQGGTRSRLIVINKDDVASVAYGSTPGLITGITLKSGKTAYVFEGFRNSVVPSFEKISSPSGQALFKHIVNFFVYENTQTQKNNLEKMANGKFVTIFQNSKQDENSFEVQGLGNGLEMADGAINKKNENNGAYNIVLNTGEGQGEAKMPQTFYNTDFSTSLAAIEALLSLPSIINLSDIAYPAAGGDAVVVTGTNFHGGGVASDVSSVKWVNQSTSAETTQTSVTVASDTSLSFSTVALTAGTYKLKVTTSKGIALSVVNVVVS